MPELFSKSSVFGTFKGFADKGYEFAAEIIAPYDSSMTEKPQMGQFLLIQLDNIEEASLGRITKFVPSGLLSSAEGEDYINTMQSRDQEVPEDLKKSKLKYRVQIKLLGAVKNVDNKIIYVPSQRRLPHLGAKVSLPSNDVLKELCALSNGNTDLGDYVLGEFIYSGKTSEPASVFRHLSPKLEVKFDINNLVSKRSVVFARAGYGKSNLIKYLISELYRKGVPKVERGQGNNKSVGVLIFDADGEYFWPDFKGRPGLCDVPHLRNNLMVFTNRNAESHYYASWKAGSVKLDIRTLPARDVIGIAISQERQTQQNIIKLKSLSEENWRHLVDLIYRDKFQASEDEIGRILGVSEPYSSNPEVIAAKSNMNAVVNHLHDPESQLINGTLDALNNGNCVVIDISLLSSVAGYNIAGLLLRKIFNYNQENFTGTSPIPVITVIEEAQSVLGRNLEETSPYVEWVKEGRKYDLGAILITQQPSSLSPELLSQADNWFSFHLLSEGDAITLGKYNSHYSHDILSHLIGEPIQGNCYMWSAPHQPFVLPVRVRSFEELYCKEVIKDDKSQPYNKSIASNYMSRIVEQNKTFADALKEKLKEKTIVYHDFENGLLGVYDKQLYMIIRELKQTVFKNELREENDLKTILLETILKEKVNFCKAPHKEGEANFLCASKQSWIKAGIAK